MYHDSVLNQGSRPLSKSLSGWKRTTASKQSKSQCVHIWQPWASWILRTGPDRTIHRAGLIPSGPPQSSSLFLVSFIFLSALDDHFKLISPEKKRGQEHHPNRQRLDTPRGIYLLFVGRWMILTEDCVNYSASPKEIAILLISQPEILALQTIWQFLFRDFNITTMITLLFLFPKRQSHV